MIKKNRPKTQKKTDMAQKINIDQKRIEAILTCLESSDGFVLELISVINEALSTNNQIKIDDCLEYWEEIAELDCIPDFKKNSWSAYNALVEAGIVTP